jgi:hypothetical protein
MDYLRYSEGRFLSAGWNRPGTTAGDSSLALGCGGRACDVLSGGGVLPGRGHN